MDLPLVFFPLNIRIRLISISFFGISYYWCDVAKMKKTTCWKRLCSIFHYYWSNHNKNHHFAFSLLKRKIEVNSIVYLLLSSWSWFNRLRSLCQFYSPKIRRKFNSAPHMLPKTRQLKSNLGPNHPKFQLNTQNSLKLSTKLATNQVKFNAKLNSEFQRVRVFHQFDTEREVTFISTSCILALATLIPREKV